MDVTTIEPPSTGPDVPIVQPEPVFFAEHLYHDDDGDNKQDNHDHPHYQHDHYDRPRPKIGDQDVPNQNPIQEIRRQNHSPHRIRVVVKVDVVERYEYPRNRDHQQYQRRYCQSKDGPINCRVCNVHTVLSLSSFLLTNTYPDSILQISFN